MGSSTDGATSRPLTDRPAANVGQEARGSIAGGSVDGQERVAQFASGTNILHGNRSAWSMRLGRYPSVATNLVKAGKISLSATVSGAVTP